MKEKPSAASQRHPEPNNTSHNTIILLLLLIIIMIIIILIIIINSFPSLPTHPPLARRPEGSLTVVWTVTIGVL